MKQKPELKLAEKNSALTPKQIANWKRAFPELRILPDASVNEFRNRLQNIINRKEG